MIPTFRRHPYLFGAFALAVALALFFAARFITSVVYWAGHQNEPVQPWMTVGYVGHSWGVDPRQIDLIAGLPLLDGHPLTLSEIAAQDGAPVSEVIARVEAALAKLKGTSE
jgi:uncharacterized membrane protein HdeD (DUF308 family)